MTELPYRPNVGAVLFNAAGRVFVGRRADLPSGAPASWQLPQGGIDEGEDPRAAVLREIGEEVGTDRVTILEEYPSWLTYDLPPDLASTAFRGRFRGQRQKWFALRFHGADEDIVLDRDPHPEFIAWRWAELGELPALAVPFKREIYTALARHFAHLAVAG